MSKRNKQLSPGQRATVAAYHEQAYGAGRFFAIHMLEVIAGMKRARAREYGNIPRDRFQPDMYFVRGFLDATLPIIGDTLPMMRTDFGRALQEAIMDDFFDNAEATLRKLNERSPDVRARF